MEESPQSAPAPEPARDITQEQYRGPGVSVAVAGEGFFRHLLWGGLGLAIGFTFAAILPKFSSELVEALRDKAELWVALKPGGLAERLKSGSGKFIFGVFGEGEHINKLHVTPTTAYHTEWMEKTLTNKKHGFGYSFLSHIPGSIPIIGKYINQGLVKLGKGEERWSNALTFGGGAGAFGYLFGWVSALFAGAHKGNEGRNQFERAQREIIDLRAEQEMAEGGNTPSNPMESRIDQASLEAAPAHHVLHAHDEHAAHHPHVHSSHQDAKPTVDAASIAHQGQHQPDGAALQA